MVGDKLLTSWWPARRERDQRREERGKMEERREKGQGHVYFKDMTPASHFLQPGPTSNIPSSYELISKASTLMIQSPIHSTTSL
jgi:hypothetical protein